MEFRALTENSGGIVMNGKERRERRWRFKPNERFMRGNQQSIRGALEIIVSNLDKEDGRVVVPLGNGDPSAFQTFRTTSTAEDAVVEAVRSKEFNGYPPSVGIVPARRAVSDYLSKDLPYNLSQDDVFLTVGCSQAIEIVVHVLGRSGTNILLPRPGFPVYDARCHACGVETRFFDLLPDQHWEIDLEAVESMADENTMAMVIINPGNPCGNVFTRQHLEKVALIARKLGIVVIADEVYAHLNFGKNPFIPMGTFGSIVPVITLGSISKRWVVPGWRLGWIAACDPNGVLKQEKIMDCIRNYLNVSSDPATIMQAAIPKILEQTSKHFFDKTLQLLKLTADICYDAVTKIDCIHCPHRPEGSMFVMVKLDLTRLETIADDMDFCSKLSTEESVIVLPGSDSDRLLPVLTTRPGGSTRNSRVKIGGSKNPTIANRQEPSEFRRTQTNRRTRNHPKMDPISVLPSPFQEEKNGSDQYRLTHNDTISSGSELEPVVSRFH